MRKFPLITAFLLIFGLFLSSIAYSLTDFSLPSLIDLSKEVSLSQFKGRVILLNFWTFSCPYCRLELPVLSEIQKEYTQRVKVVSVLFANRGNLNAVREWILEKRLNNLLILFDENGTAFQLYSVIAVPHTVVLDRHGQKVVELRGAVSKEVFLSVLNKALSR